MSAPPGTSMLFHENAVFSQPSLLPTAVLLSPPQAYEVTLTRQRARYAIVCRLCAGSAACYRRDAPCRCHHYLFSLFMPDGVAQRGSGSAQHMPRRPRMRVCRRRDAAACRAWRYHLPTGARRHSARNIDVAVPPPTACPDRLHPQSRCRKETAAHACRATNAESRQ